MDIFFDPRRAPTGVTKVNLVSLVLNHLSVRPETIGENCQRIKGRFEPWNGSAKTEPVAVVGFGASLCDTWEELKSYKTIFSCSGAHKFLLDRGIVPTYHVDSDPQPHKAGMLGDLHENVTYLPASICHSSYFDRLNGNKALLWHLFIQNKEAYRYIPKGDWVVTGGTIAGPRAMRLARLLGHTNLHMYGLDGSGGHAAQHANATAYGGDRRCRYKGREYMVNQHLFYHIAIMFQDLNYFPTDTQFTFHGEGLIQEMAKTYKRQEPDGYYPLAVVKDD